MEDVFQSEFRHRERFGRVPERLLETRGSVRQVLGGHAAGGSLESQLDENGSSHTIARIENQFRAGDSHQPDVRRYGEID